MENNNRTLISPKQLQEMLEEGGCTFGMRTVYALMEIPSFPLVKIMDRKFAVKEMIWPWLLRTNADDTTNNEDEGEQEE